MNTQQNEVNYASLNVKAILGICGNGKPSLRVEKITSKAIFQKPIMNYYYSTIEARDLALQNFLNNEEKRQAAKAAKKQIKIEARKKTISAGVKTDQTATHFTVAFEDYSKKAEYLESLGINGDTILISAERFFKAIQPE